jgi:hypothetical protein
VDLCKTAAVKLQRSKIGRVGGFPYVAIFFYSVNLSSCDIVLDIYAISDASVVILVSVSGMLKNLPQSIFRMSLIQIEEKLDGVDLGFRWCGLQSGILICTVGTQ